MIIFTAPFVALVLVLTTGVSGAYIPGGASDIEPRAIGGRVVASLGRTGFNALKSSARVTTPPLRVTQQQAGGVTAKQVTTGLVAGKLFGGKVFAGAMVGLGSLGAQATDDRVNSRDLEARAPPVLRAGFRAGSTILRTARPNNIARPLARIITPVPPPVQPPPSMLGRLKGVGTVSAIALTAGAGEYMGGKNMESLLEQAEKDGKKRRELDGELRARTPPLRAAGRIVRPALRAARTGVARNPANVAHVVPPVVPNAKTGSTVLKKATTGLTIGVAAAAGGFTEGNIQNMPADLKQQAALAESVKGTIISKLPANPFGEKRQHLEDLVNRAGSSGEHIERLVARHILAMLLEELD
ncbi:hypothetical protein D9615_001985 [Tricholomella constricta]|uniref:Uncharacterized protein n=1 Tax=Tricholomella constricta TaxID=117010 RepID=A0A8H5HNV2_9AGAR|nr:hypothetical protein D9615_001985 [Tricholomella constricta]